MLPPIKVVVIDDDGGDLIVGYTGSEIIEAGAFYCPYLPLRMSGVAVPHWRAVAMTSETRTGCHVMVRLGAAEGHIEPWMFSQTERATLKNSIDDWCDKNCKDIWFQDYPRRSGGRRWNTIGMSISSAMMTRRCST